MVKADGSFEYNGIRFTKRKGKCRGMVDIKALNQVLKSIETSGFMGFKDKYRRGITDMSTVYTTVVVDGKKKVIEDYANAGPPELRLIEQSIDGLMGTAKWDNH